jgi:predicted phage-related endonuclease
VISGAICGLSPYRTALDVYLDKTSNDISEDTNAAHQAGYSLEDIIAKEYAQVTGYDVEIGCQSTIYHPEHKFFGANIDSLGLIGG